MGRSIWMLLPLTWLFAACDAAPANGLPEPISVAQALGDDGATAGFARATTPPELQFPRDHGPHRAFRTEWWYTTGNLESEQGRRFGVQLVFFRQALTARPVVRRGLLAARDMVLAHAAVTDIDGERFHHAERLAREAGGLAEVKGGESGESLRIVCADWTATAAADGDGLLPLDLRAADRDFAFELRVEPGKPMVLQGDRGLSQKSADPGNASIYYSLTRLPIGGTIEVEGQRHDVSGLAWIDREWSTSALGDDQIGWDWFSLQLDDETEVMWYRLRRRDGSSDRWSRGCFVDGAGRHTRLMPADVRAEPTGEWAAPDGRARYPASWLLVSSEPAFDLEVTPVLANQELLTLVRYWEGAVTVRGTRDGVPVTGRGYLEMTGYTQAR